jgi:hypothetical protein
MPRDLNFSVSSRMAGQPENEITNSACSLWIGCQRIRTSAAMAVASRSAVYNSDNQGLIFQHVAFVSLRLSDDPRQNLNLRLACRPGSLFDQIQRIAIDVKMSSV